MTFRLAPLVALLALGAFAALPPAQVAVQNTEVAPCKAHTGDDAPDRTRDFGRCLALADSVASQHKPSAESPDATPWGRSMTQGYVDSTAAPTGAREDN